MTSASGDSQTDCPSEDELVRMVEGVLDSVALSAIESHIDTCDDCAAVIAGLGAVGAPPKPRQVGRYLLDRKLAADAMGEVWTAWDPKLRREIAVKLMRPDRTDEGRERERLLREARSLARLTHPNVVAVHDVGEAGGEVFIATELGAGDTLASHGGASADWRMLVGLYSQAARGLAAAHAAGLVHRDVKAANLRLGADGRVRVADFGLTQTPALESSDRVDASADQHMLCIALGEAVAGHPPEPALDDLCGLLAKGVSLDPRARFADMTALADALDAIAAPRSRITVAIVIAIVVLAAAAGAATVCT